MWQGRRVITKPGRRVTRQLSVQHDSATIRVYEPYDETEYTALEPLLEKFRMNTCGSLYVPRDRERQQHYTYLAVLHMPTKVVGTVAFSEIRQNTDGKYVVAEYVCALAGRGFGRLLMEKWRSWLRQNTDVKLILLESLPEAREFYKSIGMIERDPDSFVWHVTGP